MQSYYNDTMSMVTRLNKNYFPRMGEDDNFVDHCRFAIRPAYQLAQLMLMEYFTTDLVSFGYFDALFTSYYEPAKSSLGAWQEEMEFISKTHSFLIHPKTNTPPTIKVMITPDLHEFLTLNHGGMSDYKYHVLSRSKVGEELVISRVELQELDRVYDLRVSFTF